MDCIRLIRCERERLADRPVSPAFHCAVIKEALHFIAAQLNGNPAAFRPEDCRELRDACDDALEALADLRSQARCLP